MSVQAAAAAGRMDGGATDALEGQFPVIKNLLYEIAGINLSETKRPLVLSRITRRLRATGHTSVREYLAFVQSAEGRKELTEMVDVLTTNKTSFFREDAHFEYMRESWLPTMAPGQVHSLWSAGCSSGEEPYTVAMVYAEFAGSGRTHGRPACRILATDLSNRVLEKAKRGLYREEQLASIPEALRRKYFRTSSGSGVFEVSERLRRMVRFARLNLMDRWPMKGPFDGIFCRNVMIYFDRGTREVLVQRFEKLLRPGGLLFVGHSESLTSLRHGLDYVRPALYRKGA
ncbi:MAG: CheR family methyltransferase [Gemmatimonadota bacterium]